MQFTFKQLQEFIYKCLFLVRFQLTNYIKKNYGCCFYYDCKTLKKSQN